MSGARTGATAASGPGPPSGVCCGIPVTGSAGLIALPANHARTATTAIVAAVQRADFEPGADGAAARVESGAFLPDGLPQRWQKRAPLARGASQVEQVEAWSGVPQLAQNRPVAGAEQLGQTVPADEDSVMAYNLTRMEA